MAKGAVGLVAGYWPEDVYRYLATPGLYLDDALVSRPARRRGREPAILWGGEALSYQALSTEMDRAMGAIVSLLGDQGSRVAIAVGDPVDALKVFLGALKARCIILLLDLSAPPDRILRQVTGFRPDLVVTDELSAEKMNPAVSRLQTGAVTSGDLWRGEGRPPRTKLKLNLKSPAVAIAEEDGHLVYHSHSSLVAGALSWSTFLSLKEEDVLLAMKPLSTWEGLYSVLPALFRGSACVFTSADGSEALLSAIRQHRPRHVFLSLEDTLRLASHRTSDAGSARLEGVFVSVRERFRVDQRRRLTQLLGSPVLTVYGSVEAGPVLASHPSWYLDEAVGIPVTNVDLWPLNPATGLPLVVPWESIEHAEMGVKSPMLAVGYETAEAAEARIREGWLRTRLVATMDPNGLFYLLSKVEG